MPAWRYNIILSSGVEKYFTCLLRSLVKYFSTLEGKCHISVRPCNILYLLHLTLPCLNQTKSLTEALSILKHSGNE